MIPVATTLPTTSRQERLIARLNGLPYSFPGVGGTADLSLIPPGYRVDRYEICLGNGSDTFNSARQALQSWQMFPPTWTKILPTLPPEQNQIVTVNFRLSGLWWTNACRIVYVTDEARTFGFAYGTLPQHVEKGEELFQVEWREDDSVWYRILAFSRPQWWPVWLVYPWSRWKQRRFGRQSCFAMLAATHGPHNPQAEATFSEIHQPQH